VIIYAFLFLYSLAFVLYYFLYLKKCSQLKREREKHEKFIQAERQVYEARIAVLENQNKAMRFFGYK